MAEEHFLNLFDEALESLQEQMDVSDEDLSVGFRDVVTSFKYSEGNRFSDVDYSRPQNLCAYFYRYSPHSAGITRFKMAEALTGCPRLLASFSKPEIKVVNVGGGPGSDIVGMYSSIYERGLRPRAIEMIVVDKFIGWKPFFEKVQCLLQEDTYGSASSLYHNCDIRSSFMCKDVSLQSSDFDQVLREADIVFVKGLLSILLYREIEICAQNITRPLKEGTLLVSLDSPEHPWEDTGLKKIYPLENNGEASGTSAANGDYSFKLTPRKCYGGGISKNSKAQISVFLKKKKKSTKSRARELKNKEHLKEKTKGNKTK